MVESIKGNICLALGFFDSVHFGHRIIIDKLIKKADCHNAKAIISTFSDSFSPVTIKQTLTTKQLVYTYDERESILKDLGIDGILKFEFTEQFRNQLPNEFLSELNSRFDIKYIVCGYDYRFGRGGKGDIDTLHAFCKERGIEFEVVSKICLHGERVSSSHVRECLETGEIEQANEMLVNPYFVTGKVVRGRGEGQKNNFPTINLIPPAAKIMPKCGVYATKTIISGKVYNSVTSVGTKPTFNDYSFSVETFVDEFSEEVYGKTVKLLFYKYLREIRKYDNKAELAQQIENDLIAAKSIPAQK